MSNCIGCPGVRLQRIVYWCGATGEVLVRANDPVGLLKHHECLYQNVQGKVGGAYLMGDGSLFCFTYATECKNAGECHKFCPERGDTV